MDMNPLWKELLLKKNSLLTDQDRLVIDSNPELWWYRQKVNAANKVISELEKRNRQLKKEYENLIQTEMNQELWLPADIWAPAKVSEDQLRPWLPWDDAQNQWNLENKESIEATNPNVFVNEQWQIVQKGWWGSNVVSQEWTWSWTSGSWESQFGNAMWTLAWSKKQIMSSADEQLQWAAMAANKEAGYLKWLATRTGSSFGEAKLADDRANALYREQAADIKWQRDQNLAAIDQNIAWVQQQLGSTQAQMAAQQMSARSSWGGWTVSMSEYQKLLNALKNAWWWGNEVEADPKNPLTEEELANINETK